VYLATSRWMTGELDSLSELIEEAIVNYPHIEAWEAVASAAAAHGGRDDDCREHLWNFLRRRSESSGRTFDRPGLCMAATAASHLRDAEAAGTICAALAHDARAIVVVGVGAGIFGPAGLFVAISELVIGEIEQAGVHLDEARRLMDEMGWAPWTAVCDHIARMSRHQPDLDSDEAHARLPLGLRAG
jgi:hypothetical protein